MRKLKRSVARHNMEKKGITKINRTSIVKNGKSFFADNWRDYCPGAVKTVRKRARKKHNLFNESSLLTK